MKLAILIILSLVPKFLFASDVKCEVSYIPINAKTYVPVDKESIKEGGLEKKVIIFKSFKLIEAKSCSKLSPSAGDIRVWLKCGKEDIYINNQREIYLNDYLCNFPQMIRESIISEIEANFVTKKKK